MKRTRKPRLTIGRQDEGPESPWKGFLLVDHLDDLRARLRLYSRLLPVLAEGLDGSQPEKEETDVLAHLLYEEALRVRLIQRLVVAEARPELKSA